MVNNFASAAAIQQTINSRGWNEMRGMGQELIRQLKDDAINSDDGFEALRLEARGAAKFWNKFVAAVVNAANTKIEAETETPPLV